MFLDIQVSGDQKKSKEKLTIKKWPQTFDKMDCLGLQIHQRLKTISCF